jgi:hypothetical protein
MADTVAKTKANNQLSLSNNLNKKNPQKKKTAKPNSTQFFPLPILSKYANSIHEQRYITENVQLDSRWLTKSPKPTKICLKERRCSQTYKKRITQKS